MSVLHQRLISALREAGDEGLEESEIMALGGMWWRTRLKEIRRWRLAVISVDRGRYYLECESEVERTVSDTPSPPGQPVLTHEVEGDPSRGDRDAGLITRASADGSLNPEPLVLFPSTVSHYTMDEAA